ncbi:UvrD-helicase domain-containing protein, partial [Microvirga massiliensis]|uniref:UvrD-helicase domain-containing protein n=1 Tax=Microvirga massiliensis TaxID=1033741 RepID=UPI001FD3BBDE
MAIHLCRQRQTLLTTEGHLLALGGPGSGKTTIALLKAKERSGTLEPGQRVLFLSFSRAAVHQILTRSRDLLDGATRDRLLVQTYHSFCMELLRAHGSLLTGKAVQIINPSQANILRAGSADWGAESRRLAVDEGRCCFDLFADRAAELLERSSAVRALVADEFPFVIVDEFQDTDDDQWRFVRALARNCTIFCLADPDQRIFEYRHNVDPKRIKFAEAALSPKVFDFAGENHRSAGASGILAFADAILKGSPPPETPDVR